METPLTFVAGLPYNRRIRIAKGANIWSSVDEFEVRSEVRAAMEKSARLKCVLTPYFTSSIDGEDIVLDLVLSGKDTRSLYGGYYDVVVSDPGDVDIRALRVLFGQLRILPMVTAAA